jgi:D-alanyl-D-alanine carboxypeptidase
MRLIAVLLFSISFTSCAWADDALKQALDQELTAMECPGALVGILVGDKEPTVYALGVADVDTKAPMQRDFHMRVASVTKLFVGTAILLLADEGKLSLDDPISKYVDNVPGGDKITLRQLGNNTSGLFNTIENKDFQAIIVKEPRRPWTAEEILHYAFTQPSYHAPEEKKFRYSNTNSVLLGEVLKKVTGQSYADFINEHIIKPLGLKETGFIADADVPPPASSSYRNGYPDKWLGYGKVFYNVTGYSSSWTGAAGNMYSTVDDLLAAGKALTTGKLLSEESRHVLTDWVPTGYENVRYGFCLGERDGWVGHTGDVPGYSNFLAYFPDKDTTVVTLSNLSNNADGTSPAERLRDIVIKELQLTEK